MTPAPHPWLGRKVRRVVRYYKRDGQTTRTERGTVVADGVASPSGRTIYDLTDRVLRDGETQWELDE